MKRKTTGCLASLLAISIPAIAQDDFSDVEIEAIPVVEGIYMLVGQGGNIGLSIGDDGTFTLTDKATGAVYPGLNRFVDVGDRGDEYNFCPVEQDMVISAPTGEPLVCLTGQHGELLKQAIEYFHIHPDVDLELMAPMGLSSGYLAVLVMALYISGDSVAGLYARPVLLWFICPLLLYWISRVWFLAHRGEIEDDPLFFAVRDRQSGQAAGMASYLNVHPESGVIEIGHIWFAPVLQGTRQSTEALFLMI